VGSAARGRARGGGALCPTRGHSDPSRLQGWEGGKSGSKEDGCKQKHEEEDEESVLIGRWRRGLAPGSDRTTTPRTRPWQRREKPREVARGGAAEIPFSLEFG